MKDYEPNTPFSIPFQLLVPTYQTIKGHSKMIYEPLNEIFFCSFKSFGGTEKVVNDVVVVEDTAVVETWFDPQIKANCHVLIDECEYEILGTPENINKRNKYLKFKIRAIEGGA